MSLVIESTRFGQVQVDPDKVIAFPDGLIGLAGTHFALLTREPDSPLLWLQSTEDPALALPVANPHEFFAAFSAELTDEDAGRWGPDDATPVEVYVTVRAAETVEAFTANTRAPILVRSGRGMQVINQDPGSALRAPLFAETLAAARSATAG